LDRDVNLERLDRANSAPTALHIFFQIESAILDFIDECGIILPKSKSDIKRSTKMKKISSFILTLVCLTPSSLTSAAKDNPIVPAAAKERATFSLYPSRTMSPEERAKKDEFEQSIKKEYREVNELCAIIVEIEEDNFVRDGKRTLALLEKYEYLLDVHEKVKAGQSLGIEETAITQSTAYKSFAIAYGRLKSEAAKSSSVHPAVRPRY
jgi:hypothetical protein